MESNLIVNPADNKELALNIWKSARSFRHDYPMERDYCDSINSDLKDHLSLDGIHTRRIYGLYKVNTFIGWLDENDFTEKELDRIREAYGEGLYREDLEKYVESLPADKQKEYLYIPHVFLLCQNLILDAAADMFKDFAKQSKFNYYYKNKTPVIGV